MPDQGGQSAGYDHACDRVEARLAKTFAIVQYLRADDGREMIDFVAGDALWAVSHLLENAQAAMRAAGGSTSEHRCPRQASAYEPRGERRKTLLCRDHQRVGYHGQRRFADQGRAAR